MAYKTLLLERKGSVDWLTLNRPDRLNALNAEMVDELLHYFQERITDTSVRVIVLRGAGRAFCAGLDLMTVGDEPFDISRALGSQRKIAEIVMRMRRAPQPIISLIHGPACGGGFAMTLASDIRIAGESARMNAAFIRIGLSACDIGTSYFLPRLVGVSVASELMMTGNFIDARRAQSVNLVSSVVPDAELTDAALPLIDGMLTNAMCCPIGFHLVRRSGVCQRCARTVRICSPSGVSHSSTSKWVSSMSLT